MNIKRIIKETIKAYSGYPDRSKISRETRNIISGFNKDIGEAIYSYLVQDEVSLVDDMALEKFTIALGHFQAINNKVALPKDDFPQFAVAALTENNYRKCYQLAYAAGRTWNVLQNDIKGQSPVIDEAKKQTWHACFGKDLVSSLTIQQAIKDLNVLILGETGTGKELFARAVQNAAFWHGGKEIAPTASVNVAAFPEALVESELFGHIRGAFTGATKDRKGLISSSHGGTFFLDEVGDLPSATQTKLLRVIETKMVRKVGYDTEEDADVRFISATNKDIQNGEFRSDLYERLAGTVVHLPPLRDRTQDDIVAISDKIIRQYLEDSYEFNTAEEVIERINKKTKQGYKWPGNVRELQSFIKGNLLGIEDKTDRSAFIKPDESVPTGLLNGQWSEAQVKDWYSKKVYILSNENWTETARKLQVNVTTLLRRRGKEDE